MTHATLASSTALLIDSKVKSTPWIRPLGRIHTKDGIFLLEQAFIQKRCTRKESGNYYYFIFDDHEDELVVRFGSWRVPFYIPAYHAVH